MGGASIAPATPTAAKTAGAGTVRNAAPHRKRHAVGLVAK
jgi:hypothetical protein